MDTAASAHFTLLGHFMSKQIRIIGASVLGTAIMAAMAASIGGATAATTGATVSRTIDTKPAAPVAETGYDRFIVKYKDGAAAPRGQLAALNAMTSAVSRAGVRGANGTAM